MKKPLVSIVMGSDSDLEVVGQAAKVFDEFDVAYELKIISAHRSPKLIHEFASSAKKRGLKVIIAAAGGAAHLAGVAASLTILPIIGIPMASKNLNGIDSLFSVSQMPPGVPVATVGINGAKNAAILAMQILALGDNVLSGKLETSKKSMEKQVANKSDKLAELGVSEYLKTMLK